MSEEAAHVHHVDELKMAHKRAKHFAYRFDGPFTALDACSRNNSCAILGTELIEDGVEMYLDQLFIMLEWARSINRTCDTQLVKDDEIVRWRMTSFLSRFFFDPSYGYSDK
jgi:hypothetical protein